MNQKPLTSIPEPEMLAQIAKILNVPEKNVFVERVTFAAIHGFTATRRGRALSFTLTYAQYYGEPLHPPGQPSLAERMVTTATERLANERKREFWKRRVLVPTLLVLACLALAVLWAWLDHIGVLK